MTNLDNSLFNLLATDIWWWISPHYHLDDDVVLTETAGFVDQEDFPPGILAQFPIGQIECPKMINMSIDQNHTEDHPNELLVSRMGIFFTNMDNQRPDHSHLPAVTNIENMTRKYHCSINDLFAEETYDANFPKEQIQIDEISFEWYAGGKNKWNRDGVNPTVIKFTNVTMIFENNTLISIDSTVDSTNWEIGLKSYHLPKSQLNDILDRMGDITVDWDSPNDVFRMASDEMIFMSLMEKYHGKD